MDTLYIVIPAYNEEENIKRLIDDWYPVIERHNGDGNSRLIVIDDGSKDSTYQKLRDFSYDKPLLLPMTKENGGHGQTLLFGYRYAIDKGADYIFQTDSDGQTTPKEFESFWEDRKKFVAQFGYRPVRGDGFMRSFVERVLCFILRIYYGVKLPDANAPYRLMSLEFMRKYIKLMPEDYNLPNVMLTTFGAYFKEKIDFKVIMFHPRKAGKNSINFLKLVKIGNKALIDFKTIKNNLKN